YLVRLWLMAHLLCHKCFCCEVLHARKTHSESHTCSRFPHSTHCLSLSLSLTRTLTHTHTHTHTHTLSHTHTHTHTHTHRQKHTHTHTQGQHTSLSHSIPPSFPCRGSENGCC